MIALIQRVASAAVRVNGEIVGEIGPGLLALVGIKPNDTEEDCVKLIRRMLDYRIFADIEGRMNVSLRSIEGGLLLVPQFTLAADTRHGLRPGFSTAASPELARRLFESLCATAHTLHPAVALGRFGADMQVSLINNGPVTFWLDS